MSPQDPPPSRTWREIAKLTSEQQDPETLAQLVQELIRALEVQSNRRTNQVAAEEDHGKRGPHIRESCTQRRQP